MITTTAPTTSNEITQNTKNVSCVSPAELIKVAI